MSKPFIYKITVQIHLKTLMDILKNSMYQKIYLNLKLKNQLHQKIIQLIFFLPILSSSYLAISRIVLHFLSWIYSNCKKILLRSTEKIPK